MYAAALGLTAPDLPWHTRRRPITTWGTPLVGVCDALGVIATDLAVLDRSEIAEVLEGTAPGRAGSSTMPHKQNPVLTILVRSAAKQASSSGHNCTWPLSRPSTSGRTGLARRVACTAATARADRDCDRAGD